MRKYLENNKEKTLAQEMARRNIPLASNCLRCGSTENLERHHEDYSKPLEVQTLCMPCHKARNKTLNDRRLELKRLVTTDA